MSLLLEKQKEFSVLIADFILRIKHIGYDCTLGEAWRPPEMVKIYADRKVGSLKSVHLDRLAMDLNVFKNGILLTKTEDYKEIGELWESMGGSWGGRFKSSDGTPKPDGNHFSIAFMGRK